MYSLYDGSGGIIKEPFRRGSKVEDKMKGWKILGVLGIVGVLIMPIALSVEATPWIPHVEHEGDIILADGGWTPGIPAWDHAQIYSGDGNSNVPVPSKWGSDSCIESDPHVENWPSWAQNVPPSTWSRSILRNILEPYGGVEWTDLLETYYDYRDAGDEGFVAMACYELVGNGVIPGYKLQTIREKAMEYAYDKIKDPDEDGYEENPEHKFDLISYWKDDAKQWQGTDERVQRYYCSELVWAAYRKAGYLEGFTIDLDDDGGEVSPRDLTQTSWVNESWQIGSPK
ncbi:MAG: hypothetical protein DRN17_03705 [Thermoplasmata archaeon]|nr:MAG: hypothetical protein DRN17_03705 [Thermoplasmata archaeon]RLF63022.1 MAG: hypothetical protein DRN31_03300 [Thermoplasmata archaeon]